MFGIFADDDDDDDDRWSVINFQIMSLEGISDDP
jgi:hypothetical protein